MGGAWLSWTRECACLAMWEKRKLVGLTAFLAYAWLGAGERLGSWLAQISLRLANTKREFPVHRGAAEIKFPSLTLVDVFAFWCACAPSIIRSVK